MDARALVGRNVARWRAKRGLSQTQLANLLDPAKLSMAQSYISKLERGEKNVTIMTLVVLAEALQVRLVDLVEE